MSRRRRMSPNRRLSSGANKRNFRKYSRKIHKRNLVRHVPFGGIRL